MDQKSYRFAATETDLTHLAQRAKFMPQRPDVPATVPSNLFQRLTGGVKGFVNGWWTPGVPLPPVVPQGTPPRQFDYPITFNIDIAPRTGMAIKFSELMGLADQWDILRLIIERRKDQMAKQTWSIQNRDSNIDVSKDEGVKIIEEKFRYPDNEHSYATFQRAMLEEVFVKDALAIEPVYRPSGFAKRPEEAVFGLYGIAGETIQLKIDERGRTPEPPNTAYQQVIKGVPWCDFTRDDLIYRPWNARFSRLFGFSKVEQLYILANIGLRREMQQLYAFTDGNIPAALLDTPDGWSPAQVNELQMHFDTNYAGNLRERSKLTVVPHGSQLHPYVADPLKNEFDEWMARLACFCFGVSPQGFIKEVNRATAYTASAAASQEGLEPLMAYIEEFWTYVLAKCFGRPDLVFKFNVNDEIDPGTENEISMTQIDHGVLSIDDYLQAQGKDPIGVGYVFKTPAGPISVEAWLANGGIPPAAGSGSVEDGEPPKPKSGIHVDSDDDDDGQKARKSALPKGHLARLPMPRGSAQKKNSRRRY